MRSETRETLLVAIAKGRRWFDEIVDGTIAGADAIAVREGCPPRQVTRILSLAHLAPDIVEAAIAGRLANGIGFRELVDAPADWAQQRQQIGLA